MRKLILVIAPAVCLILSHPTLAATAQEILRGYEIEARKQSVSFKPSASRGESFYRSERATAKGGKQGCFHCHTSDPRQTGMTRAHKAIEPLAPAANPALLPERSWRKIMGSLNQHFGENAKLDATTQGEITEFLAAHAADHSTNRRAQKIARSVPDGGTPLRATETAYFMSQPIGYHSFALIIHAGELI